MEGRFHVFRSRDTLRFEPIHLVEVINANARDKLYAYVHWTRCVYEYSSIPTVHIVNNNQSIILCILNKGMHQANLRINCIGGNALNGS